MTTALVTGGAGFIGSHLVRDLVELGRRVRVLDDFSTGSRSNLEGLDVEIVEGDVRDARLAREAADGTETIYHLAAMISVPVSMRDPVECYEVNLMGSLNVLEAARRSGTGRVVLASSCAVYGDAGQIVEERAEPRPLSPYASSKLAMEQVAATYTRAYGLPTVCLRLFNAYGPRQSPDSPYAAVIPLFVEAMLSGERPTIHGDGRQTRDFVHVSDVVRALRLAAEKTDAVGRTINISGGRSISVNELAQTLQRLLPGAPAPVYGPERPGDIRSSAGSLTLAEKALGYRPLVDLEAGLRDTIEWFRHRRAVERSR